MCQSLYKYDTRVLIVKEKKIDYPFTARGVGEAAIVPSD